MQNNQLDEPVINQVLFTKLGVYCKGILGPSFRYKRFHHNELIAQSFLCLCWNWYFVFFLSRLLLGVGCGIVAAIAPEPRGWITVFWALQPGIVYLILF